MIANAGATTPSRSWLRKGPRAMKEFLRFGRGDNMEVEAEA